MEPEPRKCLFCTFSCINKIDLVKHQIQLHQNDPKFRVSCTICGKKYKNYSELKLHMKTHQIVELNRKRTHGEDPSSQPVAKKKPCLSDQRSSSEVDSEIYEDELFSTREKNWRNLDQSVDTDGNPSTSTRTTITDDNVETHQTVKAYLKRVHEEEPPTRHIKKKRTSSSTSLLHSVTNVEDPSDNMVQEKNNDLFRHLDEDQRDQIDTDEDSSNSSTESGDIDDDVSFYFVEDSISTDKSLEVQLQETANAFLSHIKESCVTTQKTIDEVVKKSDDLVAIYNSILETQVLSKQDDDGFIDAKTAQNVFESYRNQSIFEGLRTKYHQDKYRRMRLTDVEPLLVVTKYHTTVTPRRGLIHEVPAEFGYAAPFLVQLEALLNLDDVLYCVQNPVKHQSGQYKTPLDGSVYQNLLLSFEETPENCLCFGGYMDDVAPGETLSVKSSDLQVRSFSWILLNIHPWLRSSLRCINIMALVLKKFVKSNGPYLQDFIDGLKKLRSKEGVTFKIKGKSITFHGVLLFWVGDTPASANVAGFKESPSGATFPCRQCLVKHDTLHDHPCEVPGLLRNKLLHEKHVSRVLGTSNNQDEEEQEGSSDPSVSTGVNSRCPLLDLDYFDATISFPQDIMHVLGEGGVLDVTSRRILLHAIDKKLTLKKVNAMIDSFDYGDFKKDKPCPIKSKHLENGLRQNASQLFLFVHIIPLIVHGNCEEPQLRNFITLLTILNLCMTRVVADHEIGLLRSHIQKFLSDFKTIYGETFMTPKFHFLVHLPSQISLFGPPTQHWAMRFEGYHAVLKRLYKILHTSKNLCYSLIERLLSRSLQEMSSSGPGKFLYSGHQATGVKLSTKLKNIPGLLPFVISKPGFSKQTEVMPVTTLNFHGVTYNKGSTIYVKSSSALPSIFLISEIYLHAKPVLLCYRYKTVSIVQELNGYVIEGQRDAPLEAIFPDRLEPVFPILKTKFQGKLIAILRDNTTDSISALQEWENADSDDVQ